MLDRIRRLDDTGRHWALAGLVLAVAVSPILFLGPGNDLDSGNIFRSGRSIARHLSYTPSRPPGAIVHETTVGLLDLIGGPLLTNLSSLLVAGVLLVGLFRLLRREGIEGTGLLAVALVAVNPWFVTAATGTVDYVWGLAFVVLAAHALRDDRPVLAGVLAAAAMACRIGSGLLVVSLLLAELTEPAADDGTRPGRAPARTTALTAVVLTGLLFVPSFLSAGMSLKFAQNDFSSAGPLVLAGRTAVKDVLLLGPLGCVVALLAVPAVWAALKTWRTSWLLRFAVPGLVLSQLLFLRFPWKMAHLLPCLLCGAIVLAVALDAKPRLLLAGLVATQLLYGAVRIDVIAPNQPDDATSAKPTLDVGWGPIVTDVRCRRQHEKAYLGRQIQEVQQAWDCAKPFGS